MSGIRAKQKEKTRQTIIDAALKLLSPERSYASLSLREVAREANIAPTSFYRHFRDMEELGLTLVDEIGLTLRQLMRKARKRFAQGGSVIVTSVDTFMEYTQKNPDIFRLLLRERSGTSPAFRKAVAREIQHFVAELTDFIKLTGKFSDEEAIAQAEAMVTLVFNAGAESLDSTSAKRKTIKKRTIAQLRYIAKGAEMYNSNGAQ